MLDDIKRSWQEDGQLKLETQQIEAGIDSKFTWKHGLLLRKCKLVMGTDRELRRGIIHAFHSSSSAGHSGVNVTAKRISGFCY